MLFDNANRKVRFRSTAVMLPSAPVSLPSRGKWKASSYRVRARDARIRVMHVITTLTADRKWSSTATYNSYYYKVN